MAYSTLSNILQRSIRLLTFILRRHVIFFYSPRWIYFNRIIILISRHPLQIITLIRQALLGRYVISQLSTDLYNS